MEQPFIQVFLDYCQLLGWSLEGHLTIYRHVNMVAYELEISESCFITIMTLNKVLKYTIAAMPFSLEQKWTIEVFYVICS